MSLSTFGISPKDVFRKVNPTYNVSGIQIGPLHKATVDSAVARTSGTSVDVPVVEADKLLPVPERRLEGYRLYIGENYEQYWTVYSNNALLSDGNVSLTVDKPLPEASGNWDITIAAPAISLSDDMVVSETNQSAFVNKVVREILSNLRTDYYNLLKRVNGQIVNNPYTADPMSEPVVFAFKNPSNIRVWFDVRNDYDSRVVDSQQLTETQHYSLSVDLLGYTVLNMNTAAVDNNKVWVTVDYDHNCDPVPDSLKSAVLDLVSLEIQLALEQKDYKEVYDTYLAVRESYVKQFRTNILELDSIELYKETRDHNPNGSFGSCNLLRG